MKNITTLLLGLLVGLSASAADKNLAEIGTEVLAAEAALYRAVFDDCDADALSRLVAPEMEFFHDKGGQVARSGAEFVSAIRASCANQRIGKEIKTRRELIAESVSVYRMGGYGALAVGRHRFFHVPEAKPEIPTEHARFANLWRLENDRWLLARVFSFEHVPSPAARGAQ
jgi:Domain of unknown function (DUF4440)